MQYCGITCNIMDIIIKHLELTIYTFLYLTFDIAHK